MSTERSLPTCSNCHGTGCVGPSLCGACGGNGRQQRGASHCEHGTYLRDDVCLSCPADPNDPDDPRNGKRHYSASPTSAHDAALDALGVDPARVEAHARTLTESTPPVYDHLDVVELAARNDELDLVVKYLDRRDVRVRTKGAAQIVARELEKGAHRG